MAGARARAARRPPRRAADRPDAKMRCSTYRRGDRTWSISQQPREDGDPDEDDPPDPVERRVSGLPRHDPQEPQQHHIAPHPGQEAEEEERPGEVEPDRAHVPRPAPDDVLPREEARPEQQRGHRPEEPALERQQLREGLAKERPQGQRGRIDPDAAPRAEGPRGGGAAARAPGRLAPLDLRRLAQRSPPSARDSETPGRACGPERALTPETPKPTLRPGRRHRVRRHVPLDWSAP